MSPFVSPVDLPLTVRTGDGRVPLTLRLARPLPWSRVRAAVCATTGLAGHTRLYHGVGAVPDDWVIGMPPLVAGCELATEPADDAASRPPVVLAVLAGPDAGSWVALGTTPIRVGRDPGSELRLRDPAVSFRHAVIEPTATGLSVRDLGSTNGVFVDGTPVGAAAGGSGGAEARTGSVLRIGDSVLQVQLTAQPAGSFRPDGSGRLRRPGGPGRGRASTPMPTIPAAPTEPPATARRALPVVSVAVGAVVGGALALLMGNVMFLAFAAFGPLTMAGTAVADRMRGRRSRRRQRADYRTAMAAWRSAADAGIRAARRAAWATWPGPAELLWRAQAASARLWERTRADPTYLVLAAGIGTGALWPERESASDAGAESAGAGSNSGRPAAVAVPDAPATMAVRGALAFTGTDGRGLARWLITQLVCLHSPADVALLVLGARQDLQPWDELPHAIEAPAGPRLGDVIAAAHGRDLVVVLDGPAAMGSDLGRALLAEARASPSTGPGLPATGPGLSAGQARMHGIEGGRCVTAVCLADSARQVPGAAAARAGVGPNAPSAGGAAADPVALTTIGADVFREICAALAPLREDAATAALPLTVDLTALVGPIDVETLRERWGRPCLRAVLGAGPEGPVGVDLVADGPHLLVAGTTGSGKSELLQTLIASLAVAAPPETLTFLLVDYKGGAAFEGIRELPHVVGVLTDLDPEESERALASLRAELHRRERRAAAGEAADRGAAGMPELVVVIDEFATLAVELPGFLAGVLDIAQRGRSLGLHLVLATQRPAGVVTPAMRANISARVCLRVTDGADSTDVIGSPDAARLPARLPGRAILAAGGMRQPFQAALVSLPAPADVVVRRRDADPAGPGGDGGEPARGSRTAVTILRTLVVAAREASADRPLPRRPWLPPLPAVFEPDEGHPHCLALVDRPEEQDRHPLDVPETSVLVTGPAGSGRSAALRRIALVEARRGAELVVIDGGGDLADLADWAAVTTYLDLSEPPLVLRALRLLANPARRPPDGHLRSVIIDHYEVVTAALERSDYLAGAAALAELPARGGKTVRIAASGPETLAHQRAAAGFRTAIRLGAAGGSRGTGATNPSLSSSLSSSLSPPGRGDWAGATVQLARCPSGTVPATPTAPDRTAAPLLDAAPFAMPVVVRPLPQRVNAADLPVPDRTRIPFGIGGDEALPLTLDLTGPGGAIVVAGPPRAGVSTAVTLIADGAGAAGVPVVVLTASPRDHRRSARVIDPWRGTEPLRDLLAAHSGPLLLVADHGGTGDEHPAAALLAQFLRVCSAGQHLLVGTRIDALARSRRGHLRDALASRRGLLLAPDQPDGALFDVRLPKRTRSAVGRGFWIARGEATPVQVAQV